MVGPLSGPEPPVMLLTLAALHMGKRTYLYWGPFSEPSVWGPLVYP